MDMMAGVWDLKNTSKIKYNFGGLFKHDNSTHFHKHFFNLNVLFYLSLIIWHIWRYLHLHLFIDVLL